MLVVEVLGVLLRVLPLLQSFSNDQVKARQTIKTLKPRTLGETLSERKLKRLDKLRDAVWVRDSPVVLDWK